MVVIKAFSVIQIFFCLKTFLKNEILIHTTKRCVYCVYRVYRVYSVYSVYSVLSDPQPQNQIQYMKAAQTETIPHVPWDVSEVVCSGSELLQYIGHL